MLETPQRVFLELADGTSITFGEADKLSAQLANKLTVLGLKAGDRVTAQIEKSPQAVMLYLACLRAGLVFHPLNTAYKKNEISYFIDDAKPSLVVINPDHDDFIVKLASDKKVESVLTLGTCGDGSLWQDIDEFEDKFEVANRSSGDTALLIYTSGTTGKPKGAMITHENIESNAMALIDIWGWQKNDVLLHVLPLFHVHGLCVALHCPILVGTKIVFENRFSVEGTIELLPNVSVMMAVPTMYTRLLTHNQFNQDCCKNMRLFISGSAPLQPDTFIDFERRTGHRILERYGMTEAQMITSNPLHGERTGGAVGFALPKIELRVCDDAGRMLKNGKVGILEVRGPNVFSGYWDNPKATKSAFRDNGYFISGDMAMIDEAGVVTIVGRHSDLIITAGFNVYPREIEIEINQMEGIFDSAVIGVPHPDLGEAVLAAVIRKNKSLTKSRILAHLRHNLADFKIPKHIAFIDSFPQNAMGKIEKNRLRDQYMSVFVSK